MYGNMRGAIGLGTCWSGPSMSEWLQSHFYKGFIRYIYVHRIKTDSVQFCSARYTIVLDSIKPLIQQNQNNTFGPTITPSTFNH